MYMLAITLVSIGTVFFVLYNVATRNKENWHEPPAKRPPWLAGVIHAEETVQRLGYIQGEKELTHYTDAARDFHTVTDFDRGIDDYLFHVRKRAAEGAAKVFQK